MREENVQKQKNLEKIHDMNQRRVSNNNNTHITTDYFLFTLHLSAYL
jgi:hypothetical protein